MIPSTSPSGEFATTRWSLVAALESGRTDPGTARRKLIELCLHYWYPVYSYLRRSGHAPEAAQDLCRAFFARLLRDGPQRVAQARMPRFRLFLLGELHRFLADDARSTDAAVPELAPPLALAELEDRLHAEGGLQDSPEQALQRGFALQIVASALDRLREEARQAGRLPMFEGLQRYLGHEPHPGEYEVEATRFGVSPLFIALAVKRLRQRFRELAEDELGQTVSSAADRDTERQALQSALRQMPP